MARDAYKVNLHYFAEDYQAINLPNYHPYTGLSLANGRKDLFNGNISAMAVSIRKLAEQANSPGAKYAGAMLCNYGYDQLNRLVDVNAYATNGNFTPITPGQPEPDYQTSYSYDANGNIIHLVRKGTSGTYAGHPASILPMDDLNYRYKYITELDAAAEYVPGTFPANAKRLTNQLSSVGEDVNLAGNYSEDVDNQVAGNYQYDAIGNLISDVQGGIDAIDWTVYGKIKSITKAGSTIGYTYDAAGNRISKTVDGLTTWYVRDAQGNVMATYVANDAAHNSGHLTQTEVHLYGSSRLGVVSLDIDCTDGQTDPQFVNLERGAKVYELTNHLGNVLSTVSDRILAIPNNAGTVVDHYLADVRSATDYYAFGMAMPGRAFSSGSYRYGFNGKENDNEVKGTGNQQDYGMRIYDPRLGRFLSVDPITADYPWLTPYQFASNRPIDGIDRDGLEWAEYARPYAVIRDNKSRMTFEQAQEYERNGRKAGMTYMYATFLLPLDALTGFNGHRIVGQVLAVYSASQVFEYTNRNSNQKTPNIIKANSAKAKEAASDILLGVGITKTFGVLGKTISGLSRLDARFSGFNTRGLSVWEGDDAAKYLQGNSKAAYMAGEDGEGVLILGSKATRQEIVEELIHHQQNMKYGSKYMIENRNAIEVEAQNELLIIGKKEGWSKDAIEEIQKAKKTWTEALKKESN